MFGNREYAALSRFDQFASGLAFVVENGARDIGTGFQQLSQQRTLAYDFGVGTHIGGCWCISRQRTEIGQSTRVGQLTAALERLTHGDGVRWLTECGQLANGIKDYAVVRSVEILGTQNVGDVVQRLRVEEQAAQNGLLRLDRMRRGAHISAARAHGPINPLR